MGGAKPQLLYTFKAGTAFFTFFTNDSKSLDACKKRKFWKEKTTQKSVCAHVLGGEIASVSLRWEPFPDKFQLFYLHTYRIN